mmetsp:Transcript_28754/g.54284  ORF Transcript_28754/g.54284 Transcript_28754/m.54284 type:complete len:275 (-) Transcript_28754:279-1103(-)
MSSLMFEPCPTMALDSFSKFLNSTKFSVSVPASLPTAAACLYISAMGSKLVMRNLLILFCSIMDGQILSMIAPLVMCPHSSIMTSSASASSLSCGFMTWRISQTFMAASFSLLCFSASSFSNLASSISSSCLVATPLLALAWCSLLLKAMKAHLAITGSPNLGSVTSNCSFSLKGSELGSSLCLFLSSSVMILSELFSSSLFLWSSVISCLSLRRPLASSSNRRFLNSLVKNCLNCVSFSYHVGPTPLTAILLMSSTVTSCLSWNLVLIMASGW